jgi:hypothetical protein
MRIVHDFRYDRMPDERGNLVLMLVCLTEAIIDGVHYGVFFAIAADGEPPEGPERDRFREGQRQIGEAAVRERIPRELTNEPV